MVRSSTSGMDFFIDGILRDSFNKGILLNIESVGNLLEDMKPFPKNSMTSESTPKSQPT